MKKNLLLLSLTVAVGFSNAQVGINTDKPKATLDVKAMANAVPNGLLIPRLDALQLQTNKVSAEHNSLLVYFNGDHTNLPKDAKYSEITEKGYYYYDAEVPKWKTFSGNSNNIFEKITENLYTGIVRVGRENDRGQYLPIGRNALDFSFNYNPAKTTGASGSEATALGWSTTASGQNSTSMGANTTASGKNSTAMGNNTTASGQNSTSMGANTIAEGRFSIAMGEGTTASGDFSFAMGDGTIASGFRSTAMGWATEASGKHSTTIGTYTIASNYGSIATGGSTTASGLYSFTMGVGTIAEGQYSIATGYRTIASGENQLVIGKYNDPRNDSTAFIVGKGTAKDKRLNAFRVDFNGDVFTIGNVYARKNLYASSDQFPDYVFEKYYKGVSALKSDYIFNTLAEIEAYVKKNGHLPGYKSAKTIKEEGTLNMTDTQLTNVEKIEELFLHTIEQEKAIKAKDAKISELEAALKAQGAKLKAQDVRLKKLEQLIK